MGKIWLETTDNRLIHLPIVGEDFNSPDDAIRIPTAVLVNRDRCFSGTIQIVSPQYGTITFAWDEPEDLEVITQWELHWGSTTGGPYAKLTDIQKDGNFQEPVTVDISGPPGTDQVRYFVLKACGDQPQSGGGTAYECSENSNEASFSVWIPPAAFSVPVNFRIIPE